MANNVAEFIIKITSQGTGEVQAFAVSLGNLDQAAAAVARSMLAASAAQQQHDNSLKNAKAPADEAKNSYTGLLGAIQSLNGQLNVSLSFAGLIGLARSAGEAVRDVEHLADAMGSSITDASRLSYALERTGHSAAALEGTMFFASASLAQARQGAGEAATAFAKLNIDPKGVRDLNDLIMKVADAYRSSLLPQEEKDLALREIFGRQIRTLLPLLNLGSDGIRKLGEEGERSGRVFDEELTQRVDDFNAHLKQLQDQVRFGIGLPLLELIEQNRALFDAVVKIGGVIAAWKLLQSLALPTLMSAITSGIIGISSAVTALVPELTGAGVAAIGFAESFAAISTGGLALIALGLGAWFLHSTNAAIEARAALEQHADALRKDQAAAKELQDALEAAVPLTVSQKARLVADTAERIKNAEATLSQAQAQLTLAQLLDQKKKPDMTGLHGPANPYANMSPEDIEIQTKLGVPSVDSAQGAIQSQMDRIRTLQEQLTKLSSLPTTEDEAQNAERLRRETQLDDSLLAQRKALNERLAAEDKTALDAHDLSEKEVNQRELQRTLDYITLEEDLKLRAANRNNDEADRLQALGRNQEADKLRTDAQQTTEELLVLAEERNKVLAEANDKNIELTNKQTETAQKASLDLQIRQATAADNQILLKHLQTQRELADLRKQLVPATEVGPTPADFKLEGIQEQSDLLAQFDDVVKRTNDSITFLKGEITDTSTKMQAGAISTGAGRQAIAGYESQIHSLSAVALPELQAILNALDALGKLHPEIKINTKQLELALAKIKMLQDEAAGPKAVSQVQQLFNAWTDLGKQLDQLEATTLSRLADETAQLFGQWLEGTMNAKKAFEQFAVSVIEQIVRILVQQIIANTIMRALGASSTAETGAQAASTAATLTTSYATPAALAAIASYGGAAYSGMAATLVALSVVNAAAAASQAVGGAVGGSGFAAGGHVKGPGTETSDSIAARLSRDEFVQPASAHKKYGTAFMEKVRAGDYPEDLAKDPESATAVKRSFGGALGDLFSYDGKDRNTWWHWLLDIGGGGGVAMQSVAEMSGWAQKQQQDQAQNQEQNNATAMYATGGEVDGEGDETSDSIRARLSRNEYVEPASTSDYYGKDLLEMLRNREIPRDQIRSALESRTFAVPASPTPDRPYSESGLNVNVNNQSAAAGTHQTIRPQVNVQIGDDEIQRQNARPVSEQHFRTMVDKHADHIDKAIQRKRGYKS